jgi:TolB-like protein/Tfp pilus assembly protein PilF
MTSERWQQVNDLFQLAAERAPEERTIFLERACQGDEGLRREVESLIASHERAEHFIESPAFEVVPELLTNNRTSAIIGEAIGHYQIECLLGIGGMGEVYLARDEQLGRKVALKFLPERLTANKAQLSRFKTEARAASALNHPNILTVYEIGTEGNRHFIATEFIEGNTLRAALSRGKMSAHDALDIAVQVASALAAAHAAGVVHRDIKPENIMIRPDGFVKVLDFGLAKLAEQNPTLNSDDPGLTNTSHTLAGLLMGTPRYMSPEQARGRAADARADIWSLGVVIYEMVGGVPPFTGATPSDCIASILKTEATPIARAVPAAPTQLQSILHKALRKNRDERYQTIAEMLVDLRSLKGKLERAASSSKIEPAWLWLAASTAVVLIGIGGWVLTHDRSFRVRGPMSSGTGVTAPADSPEKSIAVLPFENRSRDADNAYFADAIQDEILTRLSKIADLKVISRTSTQHYKTSPANVPEIAKQLGVAHILEGSVQKTGGTVRVNVQLIKAATDAHLWADTFDRKLTDILSVESDVAKAIADKLRAKLTGDEEQIILTKPTDNPQAYNAYLRGLAYSLKSANSTANVLNAQKYLREAVRLDPKFARAWALLSFVESRGYGTVTLQPTDALREEAGQAAQTAISLQPNLGEAILAKGFYHYACLKDYGTALRYFERAREFLPNSSRIPESLAYVTRRQGQWDRSELYFNEAERLDPRNISLLTQHALSYKDRRRFSEALQKLEQILNITPDDIDTIVEKGAIAQAEGDLPKAAMLLSSVQPAADDTNALETQAYQAILERRPAPIISQLKGILANPNAALGFYKGGLRFWLGWAQDATGDSVAARESWLQARRELEPFLSEQPDNHILLGDLALTAMSLGDKPAAFDFAARGIAALPFEKDAVRGPAPTEIFARVAATMGEPDRAIAALEKLLSIPYSGALGPGAPLTPALLRLDPMFDRLRNDPRFEKLVQQVQEPVATAIPAKSLAVLPFENLSLDPDNGFFTDGVQDEILTDLARVADLKVISRTSVMQYKTGAKRNLRQIGNDLGVAHVVEGSVQRSGNRVRVNAQLIDARTDAHVWAQTYDRDLSDVFAIQTEIATAIADQLRAKLSPTEKSAIGQAPTTDITAFNLYSHARNLFLTAFAGPNGRGDLLQAADLLKQALARDPQFFQAYCQLAFTEINIYGVVDHNPVYLTQAEAALESAARLRPDAGETHLARARNLYWGYHDYDGALRELEMARQSLPGEDWIFSLKGYIQRRQGRWEECVRDLERAAALDPRNVLTLQQLALTYQQLRRYSEEKSTYERILAFEPNDPVTRSSHAFVELDSKADTRPLHQVTDSIRDRNPAALPSIADNWLLCAFAERDVAAAKEAVAALGDNSATLGATVDVRFNRPFLEGLIATMARDDASARSAFTAARAQADKNVQAQPNYAPALCVLGLIDAALGQKDEALREGRRAVELCPMEKDALMGVAALKYFAMIAAWVGEKNVACEQLAIATSKPGDLSYGQLKVMPFWDPLRGYSRFEEIVASLAPKETALKR